MLDDIQWAQDSRSIPFYANIESQVHLPHRSNLHLGFAHTVLNQDLVEGPGVHHLLRQLRTPGITALWLSEPQPNDDLIVVRDIIMASASSNPPRITSLEIGLEPSVERDISDGLISLLLLQLPLLEHLDISTAFGESPAVHNINSILLALRWTCTFVGTSSLEETMGISALAFEAHARNICLRLERLSLSHVIVDSTVLKCTVESRARGSDDNRQQGAPWRLEFVFIEGLVFTDTPATSGGSDLADAGVVQLPWMVEMTEEGFIRVDPSRDRIFAKDTQPYVDSYH